MKVTVSIVMTKMDQFDFLQGLHKVLLTIDRNCDIIGNDLEMFPLLKVRIKMNGHIGSDTLMWKVDHISEGGKQTLHLRTFMDMEIQELLVTGGQDKKIVYQSCTE